MGHSPGADPGEEGDYNKEPQTAKRGKNFARVRVNAARFSTVTRTPPFRNPVSAPAGTLPME